jgi:DNA-binding transcriptional regulator YhcF (GntR family)
MVNDEVLLKLVWILYHDVAFGKRMDRRTVGGETIVGELQAGQGIFSIRGIAKEIGEDPTTVGRKLELLKKHGFVPSAEQVSRYLQKIEVARPEKGNRYGNREEPVIKRHQTEKEEEMPKTTGIDPALVDLVAEIKERGITKSSDIKEELIEAMKIMKENTSNEWGTPGIARRLNKAGIPRLRGEGLWRDADVHQLLNPKKSAKPPPKRAPAPIKHKCYGCEQYDESMDFCYEKIFPLRDLTYCHLGKWEENEGPF